MIDGALFTGVPSSLVTGVPSSLPSSVAASAVQLTSLVS